MGVLEIASWIALIFVILWVASFIFFGAWLIFRIKFPYDRKHEKKNYDWLRDAIREQREL